MGIERQVVSSKMNAENLEFLAFLSEQIQPYEISLSSLINLCVSIVRTLFIKGEIALNPRALQVLLRHKGLPLRGGVNEAGLSPTPRPIQARFNFFSRLRSDRGHVGLVAVAWGTSHSANLRVLFAGRRIA